MLDRILALPVTRQLTPTISMRQMGEIPLVVVEHPTSSAVVSLHGAQLLYWQPAGEFPVLWLSEQSAWTQGVAIRGGIPVCWPWFADQGTPAHGFARTSMWRLAAPEDRDDGVGLTLTFDGAPRTRELWPHDFTLTCRIRLGRECTVEIEADSDHPSTAALHTYLDVGTADQTEITGLGTDFVDKVRDGARGRQDGPLTVTGHIDRIYTGPDAVSAITNRQTGRTIHIRHHHHSEVVVWNPGPTLSRSMADLADDAHRRFACVETARITRPLERAAPGRPARLATELICGPFAR